MRKVLFSILLLQAAAAFAQPTISAEVSSDPLPFQATPFPFAVPAIAMAKDRTGVAIAWVMREPGGDNRIFVGRLDATAHFTGSVHSIPVLSQSMPIEAITPSLAAATNGDGFTLAWLEMPPTNSRSAQVVYCHLDAALKASPPVALPTPARAISSPAIVRSRKTTWISASGYAWQIRGDGSIDGPFDAGMTASDMTVATDSPQMVTGQRFVPDVTTCNAPGCSRGFRGWCTCSQFEPFYSLQFLSLSTVSSTKNFNFDAEAIPAIGSSNSDVLVALFQGTQHTGGAVVTFRLKPSAFKDFPTAADNWRVIGHVEPDPGYSRPDIASDDERYVVVWRTTADVTGSHDIVGASIERNGTIIPLSIATLNEDERDPSVVAVGNGRFLVAYDKLSNGERRIAGRFVTFENRAHAVR